MENKTKDNNGELHSDIEEGKVVKTELSLPERYEDVVSDVQKEIMTEEISEFVSIKENDINISTVYVYDDGDEIDSKVYFRNGFSRKVNFEYVPLIMVNSKNEILGGKVFDLREMGDIPPCGARPWKITFDKSEIDMNKFSPMDCKILFDKKIKAVNYANIELEELEENMQELKSVFQDFLNDLPKIEKGNVSISKFNLALSSDGNIMITLLVRNSTDKTINIEEIPITLKDENSNIAASGRFTLHNFVVGSMKAKVCTLAFKTEVSLSETISLDKWNVFFEYTS